MNQILLRLDDDEKQLSNTRLKKIESTVDADDYNRLLSSQVAIFKSEIESFIWIWKQIERDGPITKANYQ